jgi:hypothetical protein
LPLKLTTTVNKIKSVPACIKRRMGNDLKQKILVQNGIIAEQQIERKPSILNCPRCSLVNAIENKYCSKCSYPLVPSAFDEIKAAEEIRFQDMEERFNSMQSQIQSLMSAFSTMKEQPQVDSMAKTLYSSGILVKAENKEERELIKAAGKAAYHATKIKSALTSEAKGKSKAKPKKNYS